MGVCGCLRMVVGVCGGWWVFENVGGCLRRLVGVCGCWWVFENVGGCLWVL